MVLKPANSGNNPNLGLRVVLLTRGLKLSLRAMRCSRRLRVVLFTRGLKPEGNVLTKTDVFESRVDVQKG